MRDFAKPYPALMIATVVGAPVAAAVVFVDTSAGPHSGVLPKLRCAADHSSPYVLVLEGRIDAEDPFEDEVPSDGDLDYEWNHHNARRINRLRVPPTVRNAVLDREEAV